MDERTEEIKLDVGKLQIGEAQVCELQCKLERKSSTPVQSASNKKCEIKLTNYAWDETPKLIKFYVTIPNVHTVSPDNISCHFTERTLKLQVGKVDNKEYVLTIKNLLNDINPDESSWKIKKDMIIISAAKTKEATWSHVTVLEKRSKDAEKPKENSYDHLDINDGIMALMKDMYQQGDDEMKRIIAQAWSESEEKATGEMFQNISQIVKD